ncbi:MAG TPA: TetR family transcriptional regulator [Marmoricola sp.]|nr:TetR family transcriptional regulator [Marmoricola sp.]
MTGRAEAMRRTREQILDAALEMFGSSYFDEVTLADVAAAASVSQQTVVNHFGSKGQLYLTGVRERFAPAIAAERARARPGDVGSIVDVVVADYEERGDALVRGSVLAGRFPELAETFAGGRAAHRAWVATVFAPQLRQRRGRRRERTTTLLATVLDVSVWKQLRRDDGLDVTATRDHLRRLVEAVLAT